MVELGNLKIQGTSWMSIHVLVFFVVTDLHCSLGCLCLGLRQAQTSPSLDDSGGRLAADAVRSSRLTVCQRTVFTAGAARDVRGSNLLGEHRSYARRGIGIGGRVPGRVIGLTAVHHSSLWHMYTGGTAHVPVPPTTQCTPHGGGSVTQDLPGHASVHVHIAPSRETDPIGPQWLSIIRSASLTSRACVLDIPCHPGWH